MHFPKIRFRVLVLGGLALSHSRLSSEGNRISLRLAGGPGQSAIMCIRRLMCRTSSSSRVRRGVIIDYHSINITLPSYALADFYSPPVQATDGEGLELALELPRPGFPRVWTVPIPHLPARVSLNPTGTGIDGTSADSTSIPGKPRKKWSPLLCHSWLGSLRVDRGSNCIVSDLFSVPILPPTANVFTSFWNPQRGATSAVAAMACFLVLVVGSRVGVTSSPPPSPE